MSVYRCVCCDTCGDTGELSAGGEYPSGWGRVGGNDHCAEHEPGAVRRRQQDWAERLQALREEEAKAKAWAEQPVRRCLITYYPKFPLEAAP